MAYQDNLHEYRKGQWGMLNAEALTKTLSLTSWLRHVLDIDFEAINDGIFKIQYVFGSLKMGTFY